jgi:hypothetical protein
VDLLEFDRRGVSLAKIDQREQSARKLGTVRASERSFLFGNCDTLAKNALEELLANARASGGNRVVNVRFRGRWTWKSEVLCRRNAGYVFLVIPAFLPIPMSVTVSGVLLHDPERGAADGVDAGTPGGTDD